MDATFVFLENLNNIIGVGIIAATAFTYVFASYFKKSWTDSQKLKEAVYVRELLDTKKSLQLILDDTNRESQPVFYSKIESLLNDINREIISYATKKEPTLQLQNILKGDLKLAIFKKVHRSWVDVLSAMFFGFIYWVFWFTVGFGVISDVLDTSSKANDIAIYLLLAITTLSIFFATSSAYKKYFKSSGFLAWLKKNILFGIYAMLFAFGYLFIYWLILSILTS